MEYTVKIELTLKFDDSAFFNFLLFLPFAIVCVSGGCCETMKTHSLIQRTQTNGRAPVLFIYYLHDECVSVRLWRVHVGRM